MSIYLRLSLLITELFNVQKSGQIDSHSETIYSYNAEYIEILYSIYLPQYTVLRVQYSLIVGTFDHSMLMEWAKRHAGLNLLSNHQVREEVEGTWSLRCIRISAVQQLFASKPLRY